jgi:hypothetical protein
LPAHEQYQAKTEKQEKKAHEQVLDADHFMVGGENILGPK